MRKRASFTLIFFAGLLLSFPALAEEGKPIQWWQVVSGIIAIPVTLFGLVASYATFVKTRLEAQKIELEIREKQRLLAESGSTSLEAQQVAQTLMKPLVDNTRVNYIIMRFVILYLVLLFWDVFAKVVNFIATGTFLTLTNVFGMPGQGAPVMVMYSVTVLVQFGWFAIVLLVGIPLYKDIATHVGFKLPWEREPA